MGLSTGLGPHNYSSGEEVMLLCRWEELNSLAEQRRRLLRGAEQVHKFVRDAAETNDRMNEKASFVTTTSTTCKTYM